MCLCLVPGTDHTAWPSGAAGWPGLAGPHTANQHSLALLQSLRAVLPVWSGGRCPSVPCWEALLPDGWPWGCFCTSLSPAQGSLGLPASHVSHGGFPFPGYPGSAYVFSGFLAQAAADWLTPHYNGSEEIKTRNLGEASAGWVLPRTRDPDLSNPRGQWHPLVCGCILVFSSALGDSGPNSSMISPQDPQ